MAYFPIFMDITNKKCLVVGGGRVAARKVSMLLDFDASVTVVSLVVCDEIRALANVKLFEKPFEEADLEDAVLVIAATDNNSLNHKISQLSKARNIPVNVVDCKDECSFILPSYVKEENLVAAFSSAGNSPALTQYLKAQEQSVLTPFLGQVNEYLGAYRKYVQEKFFTEAERKKVFQELLNNALSEGTIPSDENTLELINKFIKE